MAYLPSCKEEEEFLKNFDPSKYQNPGVAADTALFAVKDGAVFILLIERGQWPFKGFAALPGGFVNLDEDIANGAKRELKEETGIEIEYSEQVLVWGKPDRDPRQRVITVSFAALAGEQNMSASAGDDAHSAEWFKISKYKKEIGDKYTTISYTLDGTKQMTAAVRFPSGRIQQILCIQNSSLAFDHAESIAVSIEYLKRRIDILAAMSLNVHEAAKAIMTVNGL